MTKNFLSRQTNWVVLRMKSGYCVWRSKTLQWPITELPKASPKDLKNRSRLRDLQFCLSSNQVTQQKNFITRLFNSTVPFKNQKLLTKFPRTNWLLLPLLLMSLHFTTARDITARELHNAKRFETSITFKIRAFIKQLRSLSSFMIFLLYVL